MFVSFWYVCFANTRRYVDTRRLYTLCILKKSNGSRADMVTVYTTYIRPILEYASPVWHTSITSKQSNKLEFIQKRALKIIVGYNVEYPNALTITNLDTLSSRRDSLLLSFGKKLMISEHHKHLLPLPKSISSTRQLRNMSGFPTIKCNTERYRKSTIPHLARILK